MLSSAVTAHAFVAHTTHIPSGLRLFDPPLFSTFQLLYSTMKMHSRIFPTLLILLGVCNRALKVTVASDLSPDAQILCGPSYRSISPLHETNNFVAPSHLQVNLFNDADHFGGVDAIEKILQIEVFRGNVSYHSNPIVAQIKTTYLLKNGQIRSVANGKGGVLVGVVRFDDGQYLTSVKLNAGDVFLDHIRFCRSGDTEECFGPYGGAVDSPPNYVLSKEQSVIVSLLGHAADVVNRIRVYYETGKVHRISIDILSASFQQITAPAIASDLDFHSTKSKLTFDNLGQSKAQSSEILFQETVTTFESSEVFNQPLYSNVAISSSTNEIQVFYQDESIAGGVVNNFSIGSSFPKLLSSLTNSSFYAQQLQQTISSQYVITVLPNTVITAKVYWRKLMYSYYWKIPVLCYYAANPTVAIVDIESNWMEGTIFGSQAFPESYLSLTSTKPEDDIVDIPTRSPSSIAYALVRNEKNAHSANWTSEAPSDSPLLLPSEVPSDFPSDMPPILPPPSPSNSPSDTPSFLSSEAPLDSLSDVPSSLPSANEVSADDYVDENDIMSNDDFDDCEGEDVEVGDDEYVDCGSSTPSFSPSDAPSLSPSGVPSDAPSGEPSDAPSDMPSYLPSEVPSDAPSVSDDSIECGSGTPTGTPSDWPSDPYPDAGPVATSPPMFDTVALSPAVLSSTSDRRPVSVVTSNNIEDSNPAGSSSGGESFMCFPNLYIVGCSTGVILVDFFLGTV
jgi:hypothetical protein